MTPTPHHRILSALISRTRRRVRSIGAVATLGGGLAAWLVAVTVGALILGSLDEPGEMTVAWLRGGTFGLAIGVSVGLLVWYLIRPWRSFRDPGAVARLIERVLPGAKGLTSAVQFDRADVNGEDRGWSDTLAAAHVDEVSGRVDGIDLSPVADPRPAAWGVASALLAAVVYLVAGGVAGEGFTRGKSRLFEGPIVPGSVEDGETGPRAELITGDLALTFRYPAYTGLGSRTIRGTGGDVSALKGTEIELETVADRDVKAAALVVGDSPRPLEVAADHRTLSGRFVVDTPGTYRFRFLDEAGETVAEGLPHRITVEPDLHPEVEANYRDHPDVEGELEVKEQDKVVLSFRARDDFGLGAFALVARVQDGKPVRAELGDASGNTRQEGGYAWDLTTLHLAPGDRVAWYVEFVDNDAISGPKAAQSSTRYLKVFSAVEHHMALMERVEAAWDRMLSVLATALVQRFAEPVPDGKTTDDVITAAEALGRDVEALVEELQTLAGELAEDPMAPAPMLAALNNISRDLARVSRSFGPTVRVVKSRLLASGTSQPGQLRLIEPRHGELVRELEKSILYLEDLIDRQKVQDLVAMAEEIKGHKRRLAELVDELRENPTEEVRQQITGEIARIKRRISELMAKMAELAKGIRDENLNQAAMKQVRESQDLMGALDEVQKALNEGDLDKALEQLSQMAEALDKMMEQLKEEEEQAGEDQYAELRQKLMEFNDDLARLRRDQEKLMDESEPYREAYQKAVEERAAGELDALVEKLAAKVAAAKKALKEVDTGHRLISYDERTAAEAEERLANLERLLEARDFHEARTVAEDALRASTNLRQSLEGQRQEMARRHLEEQAGQLQEARDGAEVARHNTAEVVAELDRLFPAPEEVFDKNQRRQMAGQGREQEQLRQQAAQLQQQMQQMGQEAPIFSPGMREQLGDAGRMMGEAGQRLGQSEAREAGARQRAALDRLAQLQKMMEEAAKQSGGQGGMPLPMGGPGNQSGGGRRTSAEKVEIPDAEAYKAPEAFRKELLEAMKEGTPERYRPQVKDYYEELVK